MNHEMNEYYNVLQYLHESFVDREYACEFKDLSEFYTTIDCSLVQFHGSDFINSLKLEGIVDGDSVRLVMNRPRGLINIDTFELIFYTESSSFSPDDLKVGFSNTVNGVIDNLTVGKDDLILDESITDVNGFNLFKYRIRNTNTSLQKKNRKVSNVSAINLYFKTSAPVLYLSNAVSRTLEYNYTLEDLDNYIVEGENYVLNQIRAEEIPSVLEHLVYKAAAAFAWLVFWENEGKTMDDGTRLGRNYATRLFNQVNEYIQHFISFNPVYGVKSINMDVAGYNTFKDYPLPKKRLL